MAVVTTKKIKLKDIADLSGVTVATVSAALNGRGRVSDEVRNRIIKISRDLNYQPNLAAQLLKSKKQTDIGLVINDRISRISGSGVYMPLVTEFVQLCNSEGLRNQIEFVDTIDNPKKLPWFMTSGFAGGIFHVGYINNCLKEWLGENPEYPFVVFGEPWKYCIRSEFDSGTFKAVQYLAALGHRRIGLVLGPVKYDFHRLTLVGFNRGISEFQINTGNGAWVSELELTNDCSAMKESVACISRMLQGPERPTALLCADMRIARAAVYVALSHGLRVPEDLSLIGFGGFCEAEKTYPAITTVMHDMNKIVLEGMRMLQRLMSGRSPHESEVWIEPQLMKMDSVMSNLK